MFLGDCKICGLLVGMVFAIPLPFVLVALDYLCLMKFCEVVYQFIEYYFCICFVFFDISFGR